MDIFLARVVSKTNHEHQTNTNTEQLRGSKISYLVNRQSSQQIEQVEFVQQ